MLKKEVAVLLSTGKFDEAHTYLSEDVEWNIINDRIMSSYDEVARFFKPVSEYFDSMTTDFSVTEVIETDDKVVVAGTAKFFKDDEAVNVIEACDVYTFDDEKVVGLKSYCIPLDRDKWKNS